MSMMINPPGGNQASGNQVVATGKPFTLRMPKKKPAEVDGPDDRDEATADTEDTHEGEQSDDGSEADEADDEEPGA